MKKSTVVFLFTALVATSPVNFAATLNSMNKVQVENNLINKTLTSIGVDNLDGRTVNNSNSVFLDGHGHVFGEMGQKPTNEPQTDKGIYTIKNDGAIYITWEHWDNKKQLCFHIFNAKNAYISIDCTNVFHSAFMKAAIQSGNHILDFKN